MAHAKQAADSEHEGTSDPQETVWGKLVAYSDRRGARKFEWTDTGRQGLAIVRRCAFLQHVSKLRSKPATCGADSPPGSGFPSSGASRCLSLIQDNGGGLGGGCLARAAEAFLAAAWTEMRRVALRELRDYAAAMDPLELAQEGCGCLAPGPDALASLMVAAAAVLNHMWRRCHLWAALHRAPTDLLGDLNLNGAFVGELAPGPLVALRGATAALLDSWRAGLAQLGELLLQLRGDGPIKAMAKSGPAGVDPDAGGPVRDGGGACGGGEALGRMDVDSDLERRAAWLMSWRLYLAVYRRLGMVWAAGSKVPPTTAPLEQFLWESAGSPSSVQSNPPCGKALSAADGDACSNPHPIMKRGLITACGDAPRVAPDSARGRTSSASGNSPSANARWGGFGGGGGVGAEALAGILELAAAGRRIGAHTSAASLPPPLPPPRALLDSFVSACAKTAAEAVTLRAGRLQAARVPSAGLCSGDPLGCGCSCGGPSTMVRPSHAAADHALRAACVEVTMQLRHALAEGLSEARPCSHFSVTRGDQLQPQAAASGSPSAVAAAATAAVAAAMPSSSSIAPPLSGPALNGAAVQPDSSPMCLAAAPCSSASQENTNESSSAQRGVTSACKPAAAVTGGDAAAAASAGAGLAAAALPPGALLAELPPGRVARLGNSPGLVSLQLQLAVLAQRSSAAAAGSEALVAGGREDAAEQHVCRAALVYGVCSFLHQVHDRLAAANTVSGISLPSVSEDVLLPHDRAAPGLPPAPHISSAPPFASCSTCLLQPPSEALAARVDAAAAAAGAAALTAEGAHPVQPLADGIAARAAAAEKAAAWVAAHRCSVARSCGAEAAQWSLTDLNLATVQGVGEEAAANRAAGASARVSPAWACELESRVAFLLTAAAGGTLDDRNGLSCGHAASSLTAMTTAMGSGLKHVMTGCERPSCGGGGAGGGGSRLHLFLEALLMYAGRVRLLGVSLGAPSSTASRGLPQYRWGAAAVTAAAVDDASCAASAAPWVPLSVGAATASSNSAPVTTASGAQSGSDAVACCLLAVSPACRALLLHTAATAATAATNRLVHVAALHAPGSGSDLRPLCAAHSDAVALGSAAQALLDLRLALCTAACSGAQLVGLPQVQPQVWNALGGEAAHQPQQPSAALQRSSVGALAAKAHSAVGGQSGGATVPDGGAGAHPLLTPRQQQSASLAVDPRARLGEAPGSSGGGRGLRLTAVIKINWRRSLRRIMPYRSERGGGGQSRDRATASVGTCPSPSSSSAVPPRPAGSRACWADEPIEPVPLPPPAPLCSIATAHLEAAAAQAPLAAGAAGTTPWRRQLWGLNPTSTAAVPAVIPGVSEGSDGSSCGDSSSRGSALMAPAAGQLQRARGRVTADAAGLTVLSAAEAGVLLALHTVCGQLRAAAARAGELLEAEMGHRAAMICRGRSSASNGNNVSGSAAAGQAAGAAKKVAVNLLRPLREALAGLHPASQAELLARGFSSALCALKQQQQQHLSGSGGPSRGSDDGMAGQMDAELAFIEEELAAGWRQVEAAAVKAAAAGWEAGKCDLTSARRRKLEAQIRSLRSGIGGRATT